MDNSTRGWRFLIPVIPVLGLILGLCLMGAVYFFVLTDDAQAPAPVEQSQRSLDLTGPILAAIQRYHDQNGAYPETLEALVPGYLDEIPAGAADMDLIYQREGDSFVLAYTLSGETIAHCEYRPAAPWVCTELK